MQEYTELQKKIISGEMDISDATGTTVGKLYKKATARGDTEIAEMAQKRLLILKEATRVKNIERDKEYYRTHKDGDIEWKQPKREVYTEREIQIIRGKIPYEKARTRDFINIHLIAKKNGDFALAEKMHMLVRDRKAETAQRNRERAYARYKNAIEGHECCSNLTEYDFRIVRDFSPDAPRSEKSLKHIIDVCKRTGQDEYLRTAKQMLGYVQNPNSILKSATHNDAIKMIDEMMFMPIRRPETWFN